jgi:hypothetical protein
VLHYIRLAGLPVTNALSYLAHVKVLKKTNTAPGAIFTALHFIPILQMGPISCSVSFHNDGTTWHRQALLFIGPIRKLRRKLSFFKYGFSNLK